jgi:branched-chain amino acid transport system substrate-binding protein
MDTLWRLARVATTAVALAILLCGQALTREIAILHVAPFGGALAAGARDYNLGLQLAINESNANSGTSGTLDVDAAVATIVASQPDAVLVSANTNGAAQFIRKIRPLLRNAQIVVTSDAEPEIVVEQIGVELARGIGMSTVVPSPHRKVLPLVNQMHATLARLGLSDVARINFSTMEGYIAGRTIATALKRAGHNADGATLQRILNSRSRFDLGGLVVDFSEGRKNKAVVTELALIGRDGKVLQ